MLRNLSVLIPLLLFSISASARQVPRDQAAAYAHSFWNSTSTKGASACELAFSWDSSDLEGLPDHPALTLRSGGDRTHDRSPLFYVFNGIDGKGFVIVSGDNSVTPLLAYSFDEPALDISDLPDPVFDWLCHISAQIMSARSDGASSDGTDVLWKSADVQGNVMVELETAIWNQSDPFNRHCPFYGNIQTPAGCVPTAVAIVMKYHEWPESGRGSTEAYATATLGIEVGSRNLDHGYNWEMMPTQSSYFSDEELDHIGELLADLGAAFQCDYKSSETSGSVKFNTLVENFSYNSGVHKLSREYYSTDTWLQMLKSELQAMRPVIYRGAPASGSGHMFVLDGYTDANYFHVNWGWRGRYNGYYYFDDLRPDGDDYRYGQSAIFDFYPAADGVSGLENWIQMIAPGITANTADFSSGEWFYINQLPVKNMSGVDFSGELRGALIDSEGHRKEWITEELPTDLPATYWVKWSDVPARILLDTEPGDRISFFYKDHSSSDWNLIWSREEGCAWEISVADETLRSRTSFDYDAQSGVVTIETAEDVRASLTYENGNDFSSSLSLDEGVITFKTADLEAGTYTINLESACGNMSFELVIKWR